MVGHRRSKTAVNTVRKDNCFAHRPAMHMLRQIASYPSWMDQIIGRSQNNGKDEDQPVNLPVRRLNIEIYWKHHRVQSP